MVGGGQSLGVQSSKTPINQDNQQSEDLLKASNAPGAHSGERPFIGSKTIRSCGRWRRRLIVAAQAVRPDAAGSMASCSLPRAGCAPAARRGDSLEGRQGGAGTAGGAVTALAAAKGQRSEAVAHL